MGCDWTKRLKMCFLEANLFFWAGERLTLPFKTLRTTSQILKIQSLEQCFKTSFFSLGEQQEDFSKCKLGKWALKRTSGETYFFFFVLGAMVRWNYILFSISIYTFRLSTSHEKTLCLEDWETWRWGDTTKRYLFISCMSLCSLVGKASKQNWQWYFSLFRLTFRGKSRSFLLDFQEYIDIPSKEICTMLGKIPHFVHFVQFVPAI